MAITLYQTPRAFLNQAAPTTDWENLVLWTGNPCVFVVKEDTIGAFKFAYTCQVEFRNPKTSAFTNILTLRVQKNQNDAGVFDLGNVLQSLTRNTVDFRTVLNDFVQASFSYGQARLTFGSEQAPTATSPPIANVSTTQYIGFTRNGGTAIPPQSLDTYTYGAQTAFKFRTGYDCVTTLSNVMTTSVIRDFAATKQAPDPPVIFVGDNDWCYIEGFKAYAGSDLPGDRWVLELYENTTLLGSNTFTIPTSGTVAVGDYQPVRFYCCPLIMSRTGIGGWPTNTNLAGAGHGNWTSYRTRLETSGGDVRSSWTTFKRYNFCTGEQPIRFCFVNRFGATDFLTTRGKWTVKKNVKRSEFRRTLGNWSSATGIAEQTSNDITTEWGYNKPDRGLVSITTKTEEVWTCNTGPLNPFETSVFVAMMDSQEVYAEYIRESDTSSAFVPVVIRTDSITEVNRLDSQVAEYQFDLVYSRQEARTNFGPTVAQIV